MEPRSRRLAIAFAVAVPTFLLLAVAIRDTPTWDQPASEGLGLSDAQLDALTVGLFDTQVVGLEVLGVLLTAAMIGAMVVARPLGSRPDSESYTTVSKEQMEKTQAVSDVPTHFPGGGR